MRAHTENYGGFIPVSSEDPCPICGKPDWCRQDFKTGIVECHRVDEGAIKETAAGWFLHKIGDVHLEAPIKTRRKSAADKFSREKLSINELTPIYDSLYSLLSLTPEHNKALEQRGLTADEIELLDYRSFPYQNDQKRRIVEKLRTEYGNEKLLATPGIHCSQNGTAYTFYGKNPGIMIPVRTFSGDIRGFQIRRDRSQDGGKYYWFSSGSRCSSLSPIHFSIHGKKTDELWITEGMLKADVAALKLQKKVVGLAGINGWKGHESELKMIIDELSPKKVIIALDADNDENPMVKKAIFQLCNFYEGYSKSYEVLIAYWQISEAKGIDDLLLSGSQPELYAAVDLPDILQEQIKSYTKKSIGLKNSALSSILKKIHAKPTTTHEAYLQEMRKAGFNNIKTLREIFAQMKNGIEKDQALTSTSESNNRQKIILSSSMYGDNAKLIRLEWSKLPQPPNADYKIAIYRRESEMVVFNTEGRLEFFKNGKNYGHVDSWLSENFDIVQQHSSGIGEIVEKSYNLSSRELDALLHFPPDFLPVLESIYHHAIFLPDLNIAEETGYYEEGQCCIYSTDNTSINYDKIKVERDLPIALKLLDEMLEEVLFDDQESKANLIAHLLTFPLRPAIKGNIPMFAITASTRGAGKGFTADIARWIWLSETESAVINMGRNFDEVEKKFFAILLEGYEYVKFDNQNGIFGSDLINTALTEGIVAGRPLGITKIIRTKMRSILSVNGINTEFRPETERRILKCKLRVDVENPHTREFKRPDRDAWIKNHRLELQHACFTLIKAWIEAGKPKGEELYWGSFQEFADIMNGILTHVGITDFADSRRRGGEVDQMTLAMRQFCHLIYERQGEKSFTLKDIDHEIITLADNESDDSDPDLYGNRIFDDESLLKGSHPNSRRKDLATKLPQLVGSVYEYDEYLYRLESHSINDSRKHYIVRRLRQNKQAETPEKSMESVIMNQLPADYFDIYEYLNTQGYKIELEDLLDLLAGMLDRKQIVYSGEIYTLP